MVGFSLAYLFLARKWEAVTHCGTKGIDHPTWWKTQGPSIIKALEDKGHYGCIPNTFM